ncbi:PREDICTED: uncharacterized protein LOC109208519 [Nicotiana attenuata]|uniref:uncharacterized protein LOC109208519 n=1 Tax=Nicotiana attenuata TaxID=49451 RepID=UPI000904FF49|nr:PREDICTED: uncharacterized protein LOC109208519 [Nicotiana attenuata]
MRIIGSLLYLTASRPYIVFSMGLHARFQSNPEESHLKAAKRILRYLGTQNLVIWWTGKTHLEWLISLDHVLSHGGKETPFLGDERTLVLFESPVHDTVIEESVEEPDSLLAETNQVVVLVEE